jgi:hypothetical protein
MVQWGYARVGPLNQRLAFLYGGPGIVSRPSTQNGVIQGELMNECRNLLFGFLHWIPSSYTKHVPHMQAQQANIIFYKYSPSDGLSFLFHTYPPPPPVSVPALPKISINYLPLYLFFTKFCSVYPIFTSLFIKSVYRSFLILLTQERPSRETYATTSYVPQHIKKNELINPQP